MKHLTTLILVILSISACKKENSALTSDLQQVKILTTDSIQTGQYWGLTIGDSHATIYAKVQAMKGEKSIAYIGVVGNVFTQLTDIEHTLPLYRSIFLDETKGTGTGIQISFVDNKVKAIYTNDGLKLNKWPQSNSENASVANNDLITDVYKKLVNIKASGEYTKKFERISLFEKDINKPYDDKMNLSGKWYFVSEVTPKRYYLVNLTFLSGKLSSLKWTLFETPS
jgi:hypothetical protein